MWGLGLIMLCLLAFVIIGVVSNVTLTNQQDYYGVKQTSEASSYDALDTIAYKKGICVCAAEGTTKDASGRYVINKRAQYTITEPDDNNNCESKERCELRLGEYVINPKLFNENIIVRLGSIIKASEVYDIKVQEIIPYPPKISVYISYHQALNVEGDDRINSEIPNKLDGIFEDTGTQSVLQYKENKLADWPLNCGTPDTYCYYDKDGSVSNNKWKFCPELTDEAKCTAAGYEAKIQVSSTSQCTNVCFCKGAECGVYAKIEWGDGWKETSMDKCSNVPEEATTEPEIPTRTSGPCTWHNNRTFVSCKKTVSCATKDYAGCGCNAYTDPYAKRYCETNCSKCASCSGEARLSSGKCEIVKSGFTEARTGFKTCDAARDDCDTQAKALCPAGYVASYSCYGWQKWSGTRKNKNKTPFSFTNSCTSSDSCSNYSPYINCDCQG